MTAAGLSNSDVTNVYQRDLPKALKACGFTEHLQGSVWATKADADPLKAIMQLQGSLQRHAPRFCQFVTAVHVFRMEDWSDVTAMVTGSVPAAGSEAAKPPGDAKPAADGKANKASAG